LARRAQTVDFAHVPDLAWRVHRLCRITLSIEANLTLHLSISYSAAPTVSGPTAPANGTAAPGNAAAPSGPGMAGFLAALVDQLLAGGATGTDATAPDDAAADATASNNPVQFGAVIDPAALSAVQARVPRGNILLKQLAQGMQVLQDQLDKGETPAPGLLKRLGDLAEAIAAMINVPVPTAAAPADPGLGLDPLAAIGQSSGRPKTDPLAGLAGATSSDTPHSQTLPDSAAQVLAGLSLGVQAPAPSSGASAIPAADSSGDPAASTAPLLGITQLADRLAALTQSLAAASPETAQKLDALVKKLDAAETAPQALAQLTIASDTDGTELDRLVQALLAAKPAGAATPAGPSLAARTELPPPTPFVRAEPPTDTAPPPAAPAATLPSPTANLRTSAPAKAADAPAADDGAKADAKLVAAVTARTDSKSADGVDSANPPNATAAPPAATAPTAPPRAIPAAYQAASSPINMGQVAFEMVRQVHQGTSRFSFRIDPPELGRVDVKLHVDASGTVNARLTVERSETLDMFQRDRGALEKALTQAGIDSGKTTLEFSLKQNQQNPFAGLSGGDQRPGGDHSGRPFPLAGTADADDTLAAIPSITLYRGIASAAGVNLFV
jgi:flagellar hook-length control protein FliK